MLTSHLFSPADSMLHSSDNRQSSWLNATANTLAPTLLYLPCRSWLSATATTLAPALLYLLCRVVLCHVLFGALALPGRAHVQQELVNTRLPKLDVSHLLFHIAQEHEILVVGVLILLPTRHVHQRARVQRTNPDLVEPPSLCSQGGVSGCSCSRGMRQLASPMTKMKARLKRYFGRPSIASLKICAKGEGATAPQQWPSAAACSDGHTKTPPKNRTPSSRAAAETCWVECSGQHALCVSFWLVL